MFQPQQPQPVQPQLPQQPRPIYSPNMPPQSAMPFPPVGVDVNTPPNTQPQPAVQRVYTMPEQFMPKDNGQHNFAGSGATGGHGGKKKFIIIGVLLGAILIILVAILVYLMQTAQQEADAQTNANTNTPPTNEQQNINNANANKNANKNSNASINKNVNEELEENINDELFPDNDNTNNANTSRNANTPILSENTDVSDGPDKDKDLLTDEEEKNIYNTAVGLPDTDKDGYTDATEIKGLFSPLKENESLKDSGVVLVEKNKEFGWSIYYPAEWITEPLAKDKREVLFTPDTIEGEFVEVIVFDNKDEQTAAEWYASFYDDVSVKDLEAITLGGLQGIVSTDRLTYYVADDNYVIGIMYNIGTNDIIHFRTTFEMMVKSFTYTAPKPKEEEEEPKDTDS